VLRNRLNHLAKSVYFDDIFVPSVCPFAAVRIAAHSVGQTVLPSRVVLQEAGR
jgi:hypothetical protein